MRNKLLSIIVFACIGMSCKEQDTNVDLGESQRIQILSYTDTLSYDVIEDTNGLFAYAITKNESGRSLDSGSVLSIFYKLSVLNGREIYTRDEKDGDTTVVKQGVNAIYPIGIDAALGYMKEGEKWGFVLPSDLAYGDLSFSTLIPKNSIILAEIEVLKIRTEEEILVKELSDINSYIIEAELDDTVKNPIKKVERLENDLHFKMLEKGIGATPQSGQTIAFTYEGRFLDSTVFDLALNSNYFEFVLGEEPLIEGLENAIARMNVGETALILMPSAIGYKESAKVLPDYLTDEIAELRYIPEYAENVGPFKPLIFKITILEIN